jgi:hypothetical protein
MGTEPDGAEGEIYKPRPPPSPAIQKLKSQGDESWFKSIPPGDFPYYSVARGSHRGRSLPLEMMHPDSINENHMKSFSMV